MSKAIHRIVAVWFLSGFPVFAQQAEITAVPRLVRIASVFHPANGLPAAPVESVTLSLYREEQGGTSLWQETQNVNVDSEGHYTAMMGAPLEPFRSGEPRWLGVQFNRPAEVEQPRVLLVSVPYAMKAADADTLGGKPASAYLLDPNAIGSGNGSSAGGDSPPVAPTAKLLKPRAENGTANYLAMFTDATDVGNSVMYQSGGNIGIGTTSPPNPLYVVSNGAGNQFLLPMQNTNSSGSANTLFSYKMSLKRALDSHTR